MAKIDKSTKVIDLDVSSAVNSLTKLQQKVVELSAAYNKLDGRTKEGIAAKQALAAASDRVTNSLKKETVAVNADSAAHANSTKSIQLRINKLREEMQVMDMSSGIYKSKASEMRVLNESMHEGARATGLASTSAMEFGRVVSDAPYGIRGMANNVSQLTSLLFMGGTAIDATTGKMIGLTGAIKNMWKAMMGPLGIMIAIQAIIAAIDYFAGSTKSAADEVSNLADQIYDLEAEVSIMNTTMDAYILVMDGADKTSRGYLNTLKELKKLGIDPTKMSEEEYAKAMETSRMEQESLLILKNKLAVEDRAVNDKSILLLAQDQKIADQRVINQELQLRFDEKLAEGMQQRSGKYAIMAKKIEDAENLQIENQERLLELQGELDIAKKESTDTQVRILKLEPVKDPKGGRKPRKQKDFSLNETQLEEDTIAALKIQEDLLAKSNEKKLKISQEYEAIDLANKHDDWKIAAKLKFDTYMAGKASPAQKLKAEKLYNEESLYAEAEYLEASSQMNEAHILTTNEFKRQNEIAFTAENFKAKTDALQANYDYLESITTENDMASFDRLQNYQQQIWDREAENFEITREARRVELEALYNDESKVLEVLAEERATFTAEQDSKELEALRDKIDKKKQIQEEYLSWLSGTSTVLKNIGKKNKAIAIAGLALEKGAAIAGIIVKASASNAKAAANLTDYATSTAAANAHLPMGWGQAITAGLVAKETASTAVGVAKTNIGAGISIAKIASTLITAKGGSPAGGGSGGGGGGGTSFTPSFNVVGNSNENQLAEGIANQVNTPVQAYVVYDEIQEAGQITNDSEESSGI
tara:strand:+ start:3210 stop:5666 length:2457 start_codon:yes stop_codon:yes gene_type:complete